MKSTIGLGFNSFFSVIFLCIFNFSFSQEEEKLVKSYTDYHKTAREIVYLHLNKSTYIKGEDIGFKAYVLDKRNKKPSIYTSNLYVVIEDSNNAIVKQKLVRVKEGVASNIFEVDSSFSSGTYNIKAYTNWMLNFNEKNYYSESIQILDPNNKDTVDTVLAENDIDAQFLPESGHLLNGVTNVVGVTIKDQYGYGIPNSLGEVIDNNKDVVTTFETNQFGIGNFQLIPTIGSSYIVKVKTENKDYEFNLNQKIEEKGIIISLSKLKDKIYISLATNNKTFNTIKNQRHTLMIHNGNSYNLIDVYFTDNTVITKILDCDTTSPGINIVTLFNEDDKPIAERLFFNHQGLDIIKSSTITTSTTKDSLVFNLNFNSVDPKLKNSFSVSVLPQETKSYNKQNNIISSTYLEPYVKGIIEHPKYYFTDTDLKKEYELDNLLITQGWSSYSWDNIFKGAPNLTHEFEQGITVKANVTSNNNDQLMYRTNNEGFMIAEVNPEDSYYWIYGLYPEDNTTIQMSKITEADGLKPASVYLQFFPKAIPQLNHNASDLNYYEEKTLKLKQDNYTKNSFFKSSKNLQELDTVTVESSPILEKRLKQHELSTDRFGRVTVVDEQDETNLIMLTDYIDQRIKSERIRTQNSNDSSLKIGRFQINYFLDDVLLTDPTILEGLYLADIESIEFNRFGVGDGYRSPNGFVKIYTKKLPSTRYDKKTTKAYEFPLTFSSDKKFYIPKYKSYSDNFFKNYGVIDWKTNLSVNESRNVIFKIEKPKVPVTLYIEGIANDGSLISEDKKITLD